MLKFQFYNRCDRAKPSSAMETMALLAAPGCVKSKDSVLGPRTQDSTFVLNYHQLVLLKFLVSKIIKKK